MTGKCEPSRALQADDLVGLNEHLRGAIQSALVATRVGKLSGWPLETMQQNLGSIAKREREMWRDGLARMEATYRRNLPDNWQSIEPSLIEVIDTVKDSGICLVWAPRDELVLRLVAAPSRAEREDLLALEREIVFADLDAAMQAVGVVELAGFDAAAAFAREALAAAASGHLTAAQCLAAWVWSLPPS
jgi:hypothetical protein